MMNDLQKYKIIDLEFPREVGMPAMPTHKPDYGYEVVHFHSDSDPKVQGIRTSSWGSISGNEHEGTHVDAFCHIAEKGKMHGGIEVDEKTEKKEGFTVNGAEDIPVFFNRGILLDVAALKGVESIEPMYQVTAEDLEECCRVQGLEITAESVVLVNLGNARYWSIDPDRYMNCPGVSASASQMLADKKVAAVGADNFAWDELTHFETDMNCNGPGHVILLARAGIHIFEHLNLLPLVDSGQKEFIFVAASIKIKGATASPVRPFVLVTD
ncbi:MAG: cyclase family protein [Thermodesulfobacteriota bacterium]